MVTIEDVQNHWGYEKGFSSTITEVNFNGCLSKEELAHVRLTVRCGQFFELIQCARVMQKMKCTYKEAFVVYSKGKMTRFLANKMSLRDKDEAKEDL